MIGCTSLQEKHVAALIEIEAVRVTNAGWQERQLVATIRSNMQNWEASDLKLFSVDREAATFEGTPKSTSRKRERRSDNESEGNSNPGFSGSSGKKQLTSRGAFRPFQSFVSPSLSHTGTEELIQGKAFPSSPGSLEQTFSSLVQFELSQRGSQLPSMYSTLLSMPSPLVDLDWQHDSRRSSISTGPKPNIHMSSTKSVTLYMPCDEESLSPYQCLVRQQIEAFEAGRDDVATTAQGRNKPISLGQVGVRCRHCSMLMPIQRSKGAFYYPTKLEGAYQTCQNLAKLHLSQHCKHIPSDVRSRLLELKAHKSSVGGGKKYWADSLSVLDVVEDDDRCFLRFSSDED